MACVLSLLKEGCQDITIVDATFRGENTSRALVVYAATLEVIATYRCRLRLVYEVLI